jgi:hypothetical protein
VLNYHALLPISRILVMVLPFFEYVPLHVFLLFDCSG